MKTLLRSILPILLVCGFGCGQREQKPTPGPLASVQPAPRSEPPVPAIVSADTGQRGAPVAETVSLQGKQAGRRLALLVGCTKYDKLAERFQLQGPANDVVMMRALLTERFGFADQDIVIHNKHDWCDIRHNGCP